MKDKLAITRDLKLLISRLYKKKFDKIAFEIEWVLLSNDDKKIESLHEEFLGY